MSDLETYSAIPAGSTAGYAHAPNLANGEREARDPKDMSERELLECTYVILRELVGIGRNIHAQAKPMLDSMKDSPLFQMMAG